MIFDSYSLLDCVESMSGEGGSDREGSSLVLSGCIDIP